MSLNSKQINSFHMVATCCLANLGKELAAKEKICDPTYKCLEEKVEFIRMLLTEICGYVPDGEEVLPYMYLTGGGGVSAGDTVRLSVNEVFIMNTYTFLDTDADIPNLISAIADYGSGYTLEIQTGDNLPSGYLVTLTAPVGSGSTYSGLMVSAVVAGFIFNSGTLSTGIDEMEGNCIDSDDNEIIIRRIMTELNICSPLESLPETTLLTNPCGCC